MTEIPGWLFFLGISILPMIFFIVLIVQLFSSYKAKASLERDEAYRKLAEQAASAQQKSTDEQQKAAKALEDINQRLAAIEKMLRDVE